MDCGETGNECLAIRELHGYPRLKKKEWGGEWKDGGDTVSGCTLQCKGSGTEAQRGWSAG